MYIQKMKRVLISIFIALSAIYSSTAQQTTTYFPYPTAPENLTSLTERCNYLVTHFWDHCNFKSAFSSIPKMNGAVGDFLSFMPYASADTAFMAIDVLIGRVHKCPKQLLALAKMARGYLMSDTADYVSEELYLPFAKAVASTKKIPAADREPFASEVKILSNSMIGARVSDMNLTTASGDNVNLSANTAPMMILFFTGPDCTDCSMWRIRLSADYALNQMIEQGRLKIINIYAGQDSEQWAKWASAAPDNWLTVRSEEASTLFDLTVIPTITYLNRKMEVLGKDFTADDIIRSFQNHIMTH